MRTETSQQTVAAEATGNNDIVGAQNKSNGVSFKIKPDDLHYAAIEGLVGSGRAKSSFFINLDERTISVCIRGEKDSVSIPIKPDDQCFVSIKGIVMSGRPKTDVSMAPDERTVTVCISRADNRALLRDGKGSDASEQIDASG
jgi:hypothetical protein